MRNISNSIYKYNTNTYNKYEKYYECIINKNCKNTINSYYKYNKYNKNNKYYEWCKLCPCEHGDKVTSMYGSYNHFCQPFTRSCLCAHMGEYLRAILWYVYSGSHCAHGSNCTLIAIYIYTLLNCRLMNIIINGPRRWFLAQVYVFQRKILL